MSLALIVGFTWGFVALTPLLSRVFGPAVGWPLGAGLLTVFGLLANRRVEGDVHESVHWVPALDISFGLRLEGLGFLFSALVLIIGAIVLFYSTNYMGKALPGFYMAMMAFAAAMLTLVLANDLVVLFISWELTTLCSFLLILRSSKEARQPAIRTLMITAAGGQALLAAIILTVIKTGTTELTSALNHEVWRTDTGFTTAVAVLIAIAAMTKSAQFPFHSWLPDAMVAPAPVSAYLHAAAMVKAGIFLLMVFAPALSAVMIWPILLIGAGLITNIMGAVFAIRTNDIKQLFAYSTVSQLGLLVAVIGIGSPLAMKAAGVHVLAHGLFKASGFMAVGLIEKRTGTRDIRELRGLWRSMPWDTSMVILASASMAGVPPLLGFVSKEVTIDAFVSLEGVGGWILAAILVAGAALTVAYTARMILPLLPGKRFSVTPTKKTATMSAMVGVTAVAGLAFGAAVPLLDSLVRPATSEAARVPAGDVPGLALWHGFNIPLLASVTALVGGTVIAVFYLRSAHAQADAKERSFTATGAVQSLIDGTIGFGNRVGGLTRYDTPAANLAVPLVLLSLTAFALPLLWRGMPEHVMDPQLVDGLLLALTALGTFAVTRTTSRLTGLVLLTVVGFSAVLWFFALGASDVALTQLVVEILTVVVIVLVLKRLPRQFDRESVKQRAFAVPVAVLSGVAATLATLTFSGHRDITEAGQFFLEQAEDLTGGTNVVNTILVDFRALDTLGELVVLAITAVAIVALLDARSLASRRIIPVATSVVEDPTRNAVFLRQSGWILIPFMVIISAYAFLRGHNEPGGGFIAALIGAAAIVLVFLSSDNDRVPSLERRYLSIAGAGIVVAVLMGLVGLVDGAFLTPVHLDIAGISLSTAMVFDVGVYLAVFGVILTAINRLGMTGEGSHTPAIVVEPPVESVTQKKDVES